MKSLIVKTNYLIEQPKGLTWRTQTGQELLITEMKTSRLFFAVRMLWNHFCPEEYRILPFKVYNIQLSKEYIVSRTHGLLEELLNRDANDLTSKQVSELNHMLTCMKSLKKLTREELRKLY